MNLKTQIVSLKLVTGEEIVTLCVLPLTDADIEESIESGFANYFHMLYPTLVSAKSKFDWWIKTSDERCHRIPIDKIVLVTECRVELKNAFAEFLEQNKITVDEVNESVKSIVESFNDMMAMVDEDEVQPTTENRPKSVTIH